MLAAVLSSGCVSGPGSQADGDKLAVVVSILPQAQFVEKIGGDKIKAIVLIPPGAEPHDYEPKASQLAEISNARMYAILGSGIPFETVWLDKIRAVNDKMEIVNTSEGADLISGDPHAWLSPKQAMVMVENIYQALAKLDPENRDYYYNNKESYMNELRSLDSDIESTIRESGKTSFMVFHPAWGYYARDYGLDMMSIEEEGKEPSPSDIEKSIKEAREKGIKVVFVEPQFSQAGAKAIADELGGTVVAVDPLAKDYLQNMRKVTEAFTGA
ncbi:zinc ABC transporter substrate-binding protein [Methanocella sp. CWC-04]|uniref:Zinc ABC transporter substrate-binding protein n=2 Tax=Methanooceanicella nereidis TaxID=2052831 RepID=A0AAP2W5E7_9EURY|nr:zinc ABC transporter substrate-binding protein [Methanocella sp. CWC-04]